MNTFKNTTMIEQVCGDCIVRIEGWHPEDGDYGYVDVHVISNNSARSHMILKNRIKNAWKALRGTYDWSGFELDDKDEAEAFIEGFQKATHSAFPTVISDTTVKRDQAGG